MPPRMAPGSTVSTIQRTRGRRIDAEVVGDAAAHTGEFHVGGRAVKPCRGDRAVADPQA